MPSPGLRPEDLRVGVWGREEALFYLIDQEIVYRMISYGYIVFAARFHTGHPILACPLSPRGWHFLCGEPLNSPGELKESDLVEGIHAFVCASSGADKSE